MLLISRRGERLAVDAEGLIGKSADLAVELDARCAELGCVVENELVQATDDLAVLVVVLSARFFIDKIEVRRRRLRARFVESPFEAPAVEARGGGRAVLAEQVVAGREPFVQILLDDLDRHLARADDALEPA